eukprot:07854.XXX_174757_178252_1 [CDS] Oithona nana genome sequencing.
MKCRHRETGQMVAIKKFLETDEDPTVKKIAMREIRMLKRLRHENLINLIEVFRKRRKLYLVFEYVDHTVLEELEDHPKGLPSETARSHVFQVLRGIEFCHQNNIIHRDVKPENVLVSKLGVVKLCDFGFARLMAAPGEVYTDYVATRWYRAPELLIGDTQYGKEVDIWAIGCLYAEMLTGDPLFPGESDIDQLFQITKLLGPLSNKHRQIISKNPMFNGLSAPSSQGQQKSIKNLFPTWSQESLSFVKTCLNLEPSARSTCTELLKTSLFTNDNFHISFPNQLKAKIQYEFGNQPIGTHKRISASNKAKLENERKMSHQSTSIESGQRRRLNSDISDMQELVSRNTSISTIYGHRNSEEQSLRQKIVPPPASLTAEMHERKASAEVELQLISPIRHINTVSPAESSACSPVRLKRYEGFEGGLNVMGRGQRNATHHNLRTKSPPVKKSKRKETLENLGINFIPPSTPSEKKSSNESNPERFIFLEKAFDKAFQLEDNSESENQESNETTTLIESSNKKGNSGSTANASQRGPNGGGGTSNNSVLTAIEPLSLPSVVGSKPLFNNTEKTAGNKIGRSRTPKKNQGTFLHPDENILTNSRPPSHNLPYV